MSERQGEDLDGRALRGLFQELSDRLAERGEQAQLFVVGGAAMALGYDGGRVTRDVDALFQPAPTVRRISAELGEAHGLEPDWINDAAKGFLPGPDEQPRTVFESDWLLVQVPSPQYLLAMKLHAARDDRDLQDAAKLFNVAGYTTADEGLDLLERTYPAALLLPRHQYVVDDVVARAKVLREAAPAQNAQSRTKAQARATIDKRVDELRAAETAHPQPDEQDRKPGRSLG